MVKLKELVSSGIILAGLASLIGCEENTNHKSEAPKDKSIQGVVANEKYTKHIIGSNEYIFVVKEYSSNRLVTFKSDGWANELDALISVEDKINVKLPWYYNIKDNKHILRGGSNSVKITK